ncbi:discoidin domain-containing protein [Asanoa sp. NPDC050611]|uniref:discoidin domain-containing protein n=1 Tax=Asanoa sp. NPDC050611 TaxID=3157098 RepID=UPI0033F07D5B
MDSRTGGRLAAADLVVALPFALAAEGGTAAAEPGRDPVVSLSTSPQRLDLLPRPCLPAVLTVRFDGRSTEPIYPTAVVGAEPPLRVSDEILSTYVPPDRPATAPLAVVVPADTPPGDYAVSLRLDRQRLSVPVHVSAEAEDPHRNLALGQATTASSTGGTLDPCGVVDGNRSYTLLGYDRPATAWADATPGAFPDQLETRLAKPAPVGRVDLHTHADARFALKDWDVQALTDAGWQTVAQVRGHTAGRYSSTFPAVTASAVRVVMLATNGYAYSTVTELEFYGP